ncbi:MAG: 1-acyl-sn-glycerol-3-phosphate acyltransferase [Gemmatimonadetes bacterium]|nr:1-acyl-sn-glycerol-3-phosphate acyltransferase [Gemmatimonadota bacterium]
MNDREIEPPTDEPYRGEFDGWLTNLLWPVTGWLMTNLIAAPLVILFFGVLNRTCVYGRSRIPLEKNTLLISNHQSMIDSFPIGYAAFFPQNALRPSLQPWNPAAQENFFKNKLMAWVFQQFKCIPVRPGRRDVKAINRSVRALRDGTMILFPEGTRSRDGTIGSGRPGAGMVIFGTRPKVVPVTIRGMDAVLPIGARVPRIGKRISIYFGEPIDYADLADLPRNRENAQTIVDRVMDRVRFQRRVLDRLEAEPTRSG